MSGAAVPPIVPIQLTAAIRPAKSGSSIAVGPDQYDRLDAREGLLRPYVPRGADLSVYPREHLDAAAELNGRPPKTLGLRPPR